jgi:hypothetical protein
MLDTRFKKSKYLREQLKKKGYNVYKKYIGKSTINNKQYDNYRWIVEKDGKELSKKEIVALDNRIWPFDYVNAGRMWRTLLEKAGKPFNEIDTNPKLQFKKYLYNEHCLRRFWFTQLASDRANEEFVNFIGGHTSDLSKTYKDLDSEIMRRAIKEEYDNHMGCLSIFESQLDLSEINDKLQEKDQQIQDQQKKIEDLLRAQKAMELKMDIIENRLELEKLKNGGKK